MTSLRDRIKNLDRGAGKYVIGVLPVDIEDLCKDYAREEVKKTLNEVRVFIPRTTGVPVTDPNMKSCNQAHEYIDEQLSSLDT